MVKLARLETLSAEPLARARGRGGLRVLLLVAMGCGDDIPRPPITWEGENLRFGTDSEIELCAGTLPYLDGVAGHLAEVFGRPNTKLDYYWLPDGVERYCDGDVAGCVRNEREAFSTLVIHQHELVHALRWPEILYLPLEEGLAEAYGDDWDPFYPVSGDIEYLLRDQENGKKMPGNAYPLAGHFVSYLRAEHGLDSLLELDRATDGPDSFASVERAFRQVYGLDLVEEMDRYKDEYPACDQTFYRDLAFDCSRNVIAAPVELTEEIDIKVSTSCEDPAVLGPRFDQRWTSITLDVQARGWYYIWAGKPDGDETWPVRLRDCQASCFEAGGRTIVHGEPIVSTQTCLEQGRYSFRFVDDGDDAVDYRLRVARVDSCP